MIVMRWLIFPMCAVSLWAQKTILLITDAEGVGGVCRQEQTDPKDTEMRQLLTGEINAAVEGFLAGGADEVLVWDGHDGSQMLSTLTIHPKAKLLMGGLGASMMMERHFSAVSAVAYVGQHSKATSEAGLWRTATARWESRTCC
jgi:D-amino peptidase